MEDIISKLLAVVPGRCQACRQQVLLEFAVRTTGDRSFNICGQCKERLAPGLAPLPEEERQLGSSA